MRNPSTKFNRYSLSSLRGHEERREMTPASLYFFTPHKQHVTKSICRKTRRAANQLIKVNRAYEVTTVATPQRWLVQNVVSQRLWKQISNSWGTYHSRNATDQTVISEIQLRSIMCGVVANMIVSWFFGFPSSLSGAGHKDRSQAPLLLGRYCNPLLLLCDGVQHDDFQRMSLN